MKRPETMTRAELIEYVGNLKGMIRALQADIRKHAKAPVPPSEPILTDDAIAAFRLPLTSLQVIEITGSAPEGATCQTKGGWFVIYVQRLAHADENLNNTER